MTTYLLVPGSHHGGWWYAPLVEELEAAGHTAVAITLAGLDPDAEAPREAITLDDHVAQAIAALRSVPVEADAPQGRDAVLVGHSYGGSIISGVADAEPDRVRALVYLDALVPEDGDSSWSMTNDDERACTSQAQRAPEPPSTRCRSSTSAPAHTRWPRSRKPPSSPARGAACRSSTTSRRPTGPGSPRWPR